ncbi:MAG: hypothetical protein KGV50_06700 [Gammaproteobacteria bacterium]|nr:hypothetical protein [Gammaproteobacteria bacterium]
MSNYNHTPISKQSPKQANNAQSDSKLIRLKTNLSFVSLVDWTAIILFIGLCISHCVPAYAEIKNETLVSKNTIVNQSIIENETLMKQLNETVSFKNHLTNGKVGGYYKALSNKVIAVKPNRYPLAFFMPKDCLTSQIKQYNSINHITPLQGKTLISIASKLLNIYEGATLQNKKAIRRICKAVAITTESEPPHPIFNNSVNLTHKVIGDNHV